MDKTINVVDGRPLVEGPHHSWTQCVRNVGTLLSKHYYQVGHFTLEIDGRVLEVAFPQGCLLYLPMFSVFVHAHPCLFHILLNSGYRFMPRNVNSRRYFKSSGCGKKFKKPPRKICLTHQFFFTIMFNTKLFFLHQFFNFIQSIQKKYIYNQLFL